MARGVVFKVRGRSTSLVVVVVAVEGGGGACGVVDLMVYLVPTYYFLIQLQLINHFF